MKDGETAAIQLAAANSYTMSRHTRHSIRTDRGQGWAVKVRRLLNVLKEHEEGGFCHG